MSSHEAGSGPRKPKGGWFFLFTVDVHQTIAVADETLRSPEEVVHADAEADLLDDAVGVLGIEVVLDGHPTVFLELRWRDLHQIRNFCLQHRVSPLSMMMMMMLLLLPLAGMESPLKAPLWFRGRGGELTKMNMIAIASSSPRERDGMTCTGRLSSLKHFLDW